MSIPGNWTLHFSWGCTGGYSQSPMTFNANGTFNLAPYTGKWSSVPGVILWRFDQAPNTVYAGNVIGGAMNGMMSTFGSQGCWYAITGTGTIPAASATAKVEHAEKLDAAGAPAK
jgi:hypothetical protein